MAKGSVEKREAIVIRRAPFKEADLMVTALSSGGVFSFLARGAAKEKSKNAASLLLSSLSEFALMEGSKGGLALKEGRAVAPPKTNDDLAAAASYSLIAELLRSFLNEDSEDSDRVYPFMKEILLAMAKGFDPLSAAVLSFAFLLREEGYGLNVSNCVRTGAKKDIVGLSWQEGGFLSRKASTPSERRDPYYLKLVRYAFLCPLEAVGKVAFAREASLTFLREASDFYSERTGQKLISKRLFDAV